MGIAMLMFCFVGMVYFSQGVNFSFHIFLCPAFRAHSDSVEKKTLIHRFCKAIFLSNSVWGAAG